MKNTTLCYIEKDGKCLMLHRTKKEQDPNAGKWIGIGGKCEEKESPEDCLLREIREETGLTLTAYRQRGLVTFVSDVWPTEYMHLFTATDYTGELTECNEGDLVWVALAQRSSLPTWEGDAIFLSLLETRQDFFSLKLVYQGEKLASAILEGKEIKEGNAW